MNWKIQVKSLRKYCFVPIRLTDTEVRLQRGEAAGGSYLVCLHSYIAEPGVGKLNPASLPHSPTSKHISETPSHRARGNHSGCS